MAWMFYEASSFNQSLCSFATVFEGSNRTIETNEMFQGTSCPIQEDPTLNQTSMCHSCSD